MTTLLPLVAAAWLTGAEASDTVTTFVRMPKVIFMLVREGGRSVLHCAPDQNAPVCRDFDGVVVELNEKVWGRLSYRAARVLARREETSEGSSVLFEPLEQRTWGLWTISVFDARYELPGLRPLGEVWPEDSEKPAALPRLKYGVTAEIVGYEKTDGRISRVFTTEFGFRQASRAGFDPSRIVAASALAPR